MTTVPFYREQAERERSAADDALLTHARDRHQRAADAWTLLADRLQHTIGLRAAREDARLVAETLNGAVEHGKPDMPIARSPVSSPATHG